MRRLTEEGALATTTFETGMTALHAAAHNGLSDVVAVLLAARVCDLNQRVGPPGGQKRDVRLGDTALHIALRMHAVICRMGSCQTELVESLLRAGASRVQQNEEEETPAMLVGECPQLRGLWNQLRPEVPSLQTLCARATTATPQELAQMQEGPALQHLLERS